MSSSGYASARFFIAFLLIGPVVSFPWGFSQLPACGNCPLVATACLWRPLVATGGAFAKLPRQIAD